MSEPDKPPLSIIFDKQRFRAVPYLKSEMIDIGIKNNHPTAMLVIESLSLKFQSRQQGPGGRRSELLTTVESANTPLQIGSGKPPDFCRVEVCPSLLFYKGSNFFNVAITYRVIGVDKSRRRSFVEQAVGWIRVDEAPSIFGRIFISYKDDEDLLLAERIRDFSRDAGFVPYMAPPDTTPGSDIWGKKIPEAIKASKFIFVVWTRNTPKGSGVKREIKIARENGIAIAPLLEKRAKNPGLFGRNIEWERFDAVDPDPVFSEVVAARRQM